eukprot:scaffold21698_cov122-Isochrysis_galbana.AAC.3
MLAAEALEGRYEHEGHQQDEQVPTHTSVPHDSLLRDAQTRADPLVPEELEVVVEDVAARGKGNQHADRLVEVQVAEHGHEDEVAKDVEAAAEPLGEAVAWCRLAIIQRLHVADSVEAHAGDEEQGGERMMPAPRTLDACNHPVAAP